MQLRLKTNGTSLMIGLVGFMVVAHFPTSVPAAATKSEVIKTESAKGSADKSADAKTIVVIGDSIAAGYGVRREEAFPYLVEQKLIARGKQVRVINGGISGSVTAGADSRLKFYLKLKPKPKILLLELGGNDALKGTPVKVIRRNLEQVIDLALKENMQVVLAGMRIYSSYGDDYTQEFFEMYADLAKAKKIRLIPFLLENVAMKADLNQSDAKHPNALGHSKVADTVVSALLPLL